MSWLTGLAGKAEDLLVRVDQAAGKALTITPDNKQSNLSTKTHADQLTARSEYRSKTDTQSFPQQIARVPSSTQLVSKGGNVISSNRALPSKPSSSSLKDKDEELLRFLNTTPSSVVNNKALPNSGRHSRASSTSSTVSGRNETLNDSVYNDATALMPLDSKKGGLKKILLF